MLSKKDLKQILKLNKQAIEESVPKVVEKLINKNVPPIVEDIIDKRVPSIVRTIIEDTVPEMIDEKLEPIKENQRFILDILHERLPKNLVKDVGQNKKDIRMIKRHLHLDE